MKLKNNDIKYRDINLIREAAVEQTFKQSVGKRALILTEAFPFLVIWEIEKVKGDYVFIDVETTHIDPLEDRVFRIHLDRVEVFYIEDKGIKIPHIEKSYGCKTKAGEEND